MNEQAQVLILGHGEMGKAMEKLLKPLHDLKIWERHPVDGSNPLPLHELVASSGIILFCLPVIAHREVLKSISTFIQRDCLCISIAKGLDENGFTAAEIFSEELKSQEDYGLLYGPMISEEILANRYAFAQFGSSKIQSYTKVQSLFQGSKFYIKHSFDIPGISWSVILKNVYAIIFGIADELHLGDNIRGYLAVAVLNEINIISKKMGGQSASPYDLAGLGDLITTATSEDSHHHELGRKLAREETFEIKGEGVHTLKMIKQYSLFNSSNYPLYKLINGIVEKPKRVQDKISEYFKHIISENYK